MLLADAKMVLEVFYMATKRTGNHGKQYNQKLKPLLVWHFLFRYTDKNHFENAEAIVGYLQENGISAERRSIYSDINQLNKILYMMDNDCTLEEAKQDLENYPDEAAIKLMPRKGYYMQHKNYDFDAVRLFAESVYSSRFVDRKQMEGFVEYVLPCLVSDYQVDKINHTVLNIDYSRTDNTQTFINVGIIHEAMSTSLDGRPHIPEKIRFKYIKHSIDDITKPIEARNGDDFIVSPYQLLISDSNYYLLAFDDSKKKMIHLRVDRMKDIALTGDMRDGQEVFKKIQLESYTQRAFSMYNGKTRTATMRFNNSAIDAVMDKFGRDPQKYKKIDDHHFSITADICESPLFFAWLAGFGTGAELLAPSTLRSRYREYLKGIVSKYE